MCVAVGGMTSKRAGGKVMCVAVDGMTSKGTQHAQHEYHTNNTLHECREACVCERPQMPCAARKT
jgi:hypothetical protein